MRLPRGEAITAALCTATACWLVPSLPQRSMLLLPRVLSLPAEAAVELTEEQSLIVEAWAAVQRGFVDQSYNNNDWKQVKSMYLKRKYKSMGEAREAVSEMLALLGDRYTRYLNPGAYASLLAKYEQPADNGGIGVTLRNRPVTSSTTALGPIEIVSVMPGGPAEGAGLSVGDVVDSIDKRSLPFGSTSADEAAGQILGRLDEPLQLGITRASDGSSASLTVRRAVLKQGEAEARVATRAAGQKIGVLTLRTFSAPVAGGGGGGALESMKRLLSSEPLVSVPELLIDLRGNLGGHFPSGVEAAKLFLPADVTIVSTVDRTGNLSPIITLECGPYAARSRPTYVLVDKGTASASEVFAAALQGNRAAMVVGESTYGKGLVQSIQKLSTDGSAVVLTVAKYRTPQGDDINGKGLAPDLRVVCEPSMDAVDCLDAARGP